MGAGAEIVGEEWMGLACYKGLLWGVCAVDRSEGKWGRPQGHHGS